MTSTEPTSHHRFVDIVVGGLGRPGEQASGLHDLSALAGAALRNVQAAPRGHDAPAEWRGIDRFDRGDLLADGGRDRRR